AGAAPNYPVKIMAIDKSAETVTIKNVSTSAVDMSNWIVCSVNGGQQHALLSGSISANETRVIARQAGSNIWNNTFLPLFDSNEDIKMTNGKTKNRFNVKALYNNLLF
ncbi:MAG: hypothetical protein LH619_02790, partial [Chitinophagaceae bacterium]|nr:hypothetical protein [Chitinophagaceae bacterium]